MIRVRGPRFIWSSSDNHLERVMVILYPTMYLTKMFHRKQDERHSPIWSAGFRRLVYIQLFSKPYVPYLRVYCRPPMGTPASGIEGNAEQLHGMFEEQTFAGPARPPCVKVIWGPTEGTTPNYREPAFVGVSPVVCRRREPTVGKRWAKSVGTTVKCEGWKKVERKPWKGKRENKVGTRSPGGVPSWADIARGGGVSVSVFMAVGADYTTPKARRPVGKGKKKQQAHQAPSSSKEG
jgi:hypothetical protein